MCLGEIGVVARVWETNGLPMGLIKRAGRPDLEICLAYLPDVGIGDTVLAQLGFAVEALSPETAAEALALRAEVGL